YTRVRQFFLDIHGGTDCAGLSSFSVVGGDSGTITNNNYQNRLALPGSAEKGQKLIGVVVVDGLSNIATPSFTLTYDPANTDTSGLITNTNTLGLPVLGAGGAFADSSTANSIIRSLSFTGITVTDNLYGRQGENLPPGKQFW